MEYSISIFSRNHAMTESSKPEFMNVADTAKLLGKDIKTIHNWIAAGKFPGAFKTGSSKNSAVLIPTSEVDAELQQQKERNQSGN